MNPIDVRRPHVSWNSLPGPQDITQAQLPNGITVLTRPNFNSPSVVISGYLACGAMFDPPEKLGLAHFTAMSLTRGTTQRSFQEIFDALESAGASLGFGASVHNTSFGGRALSEDLPLLLKLLSECVRQPAFPKDQVERLRTQFLTSLAIRAQDTDEMSSLAFDAALFPKHPYGRPEDGYPETVQAIQVDDLAAFHRQHYGPRGMVIVVVGAVSPQQVMDEVNKTLGMWQNPEQVESPGVPAAVAPQKTFRQHIAIPGKSQTDLVMGTLGPQRRSPDFLPASLGNNILGQFGMMGRIGDVVRERAGLAYHASTSLNAWIGAGSWEVSAGVNPVNLQRAIDLIRRELERYVRRPVYKRELKDSQANFIGRLPLSMESNNGVANALLNLERFQLGLDYYPRYPEAVLQVTPEQILAVSQKYIDPERLIITSAGSAGPEN
jgi:zinc protease